MSDGRVSVVSMLFRLLSGVKTQEKIKITELERRGWELIGRRSGDECDYQYRCGEPEETVQRD